MPYPTLAKSPLVEAVLEVRWRRSPGASPSPTGDDLPTYPVVLGRFIDAVADRFPTIVPLGASKFPPEMLPPHIVHHQLRQAADTWPLLQLGPDVMSVNETQRYTWQTFRDTCMYALDALFSKAARKAPLRPVEVYLRYINAFDSEWMGTDIASFLSSELGVELRLRPELRTRLGLDGVPTELNWILQHGTAKPPATFQQQFATGVSSGRHALIWDMQVRAASPRVPANCAEFGPWLDDAHDLIERCFFGAMSDDLRRRCDNG